MKHFFKTWFLLGEGAREWENGLLVPKVYGSDTTRTIMSIISHLGMYFMGTHILSSWVPYWIGFPSVLAFALWQDRKNLWKSYSPFALRVDAIHDVISKCVGCVLGYVL